MYCKTSSFQAGRNAFSDFGGRVIPILAIVALQRDDFAHKLPRNYSIISVTAPAPTVCAFGIANRSPFSSATGVIKLISADTCPGHHHFYSRRQLHIPVTSVVRK